MAAGARRRNGNKEACRRGNAILPTRAPVSFKRLLGAGSTRGGGRELANETYYRKALVEDDCLAAPSVFPACLLKRVMNQSLITLVERNHAQRTGGSVVWPMAATKPRTRQLEMRVINGTLSAPNGSRLSCGRNARARKAVEPQKQRLAGEATQFFLTGERPTASSGC